MGILDQLFQSIVRPEDKGQVSGMLGALTQAYGRQQQINQFQRMQRAQMLSSLLGGLGRPPMAPGVPPTTGTGTPPTTGTGTPPTTAPGMSPATGTLTAAEGSIGPYVAYDPSLGMLGNQSTDRMRKRTGTIGALNNWLNYALGDPANTGASRVFIDPWTGNFIGTGGGFTEGYATPTGRDPDTGALEYTAPVSDSGYALPTSINPDTGMPEYGPPPDSGYITPTSRNPDTGMPEYVPSPEELRRAAVEREYSDLPIPGLNDPRVNPEVAHWRELSEAATVAGADPSTFMTYEQVRGMLNPKYHEQFDKYLGGFRTSEEALRREYLTPELREQIGSFIPEDIPKGLDKFIKNKEYGVNRIAEALASRGISDLSKLAVTTDEAGRQIIYDPMTGRGVDPNLVTFKGGSHDGNITFRLKPTEEGGIRLATDFEKPEQRGIDIIDASILPIILTLAGAGIGGAISGALGGSAAGTAGAAAAGTGATTGATIGTTAGTAAGTTAGTAAGTTLGTTMADIIGKAIGQGLAGGVGSSASGGDFWSGFGKGAVSGGVGGLGGANVGAGLLGPDAPAWQQLALSRGLTGGLGAGLQTALTGGDIGRSFLTGGVGGAVSGGIGGYGQQLFGGRPDWLQSLGKVGTSALTGGALSALRGGDFGQGATGGALSGLGSVGNLYLAKLLGSAGLPPKLSSGLSGLGTRLLLSQLMARR